MTELRSPFCRVHKNGVGRDVSILLWLPDARNNFGVAVGEHDEHFYGLPLLGEV